MLRWWSADRCLAGLKLVYLRVVDLDVRYSVACYSKDSFVRSGCQADITSSQ